MSDEQNKYYKSITNKHTSLTVNLLISSINIMSILYSFPIFEFVDIVVEEGTTELEIEQENYHHQREVGL